MFFNTARFLLLSSALATVAHAAAEDNRTSASFRFFTFDGADRAPLFAETSGGRVVALDRPSTYIGAPVRIRYDANGIPVYDRQPGNQTKGGPAPVLFIKPSGGARQLVLLFQDRGARRALVIPDNSETFPFGTCLVINMTRKALKFSYGETPVAIPAGGMIKGVAPKKRTVTGDTTVQIAAEVEGASRLVYSTAWAYSEKVRNLVFVLEDSAGSFLVRTIRSTDVPELNEVPADKRDKAAPGVSR